MSNDVTNHGINLAKEYADRRSSDLPLGGTKKKCAALIPTGERHLYLPTGELQNIGEEKMDCVARGFNNNLETKFNYLLKNNLLPPAHLDFFEKNRFITPRGIEFSDAFVAIKSNTTRDGNSLIAPIQAIHSKGLIPKAMLPQLPTFDEYHDPRRIIKGIEQIGSDLLVLFGINYERLKEDIFKAFLLEDMIVLGGHAWGTPKNGVYERTEDDINHCYLNHDLPAFQAYDNYLDAADWDFIKNLAPDYIQTDFGYRTVITVIPHVKVFPIEQPKKKENFWDWFKKLLTAFGFH